MNKRRKLHLLAFGLYMALLFGNTLCVHAKEASAATEQPPEEIQAQYKIYVNRGQNCVTIVQTDAQGNETPIKAMACSCGRTGHMTPAGTYTTSNYYDWCLMVDGTYGRYAIRFNKAIMLHSVPYTAKSQDTLEWDQYNLLGENASLGCVRLCITDIKWIYDNCKPGTPVIVYQDNENSGPLGKPEISKIDENSPCRGWDPTDPDPQNPWHLGYRADVTYESFDAIGYAERYPDVKNAFGTDKDLLWQHYIQYGIYERRTV